jgi:hypothetical protein
MLRAGSIEARSLEMFCPQCGQQQVSDVTRFCSRCGFLLDGVMAVLAAGGAVPTRYLTPGSRKLSARSKGVRQGAIMMLSTILIVPIVSIISVFILGYPEVIIPLAAISLFVGGLVRILYALIMEDAVAPMEFQQMAGYAAPVAPQFDRSVRNAALPPPSVNPTTGWRPRPNTAEIYQPPSVTENTTRLLDKEDPKNR